MRLLIIPFSLFLGHAAMAQKDDLPTIPSDTARWYRVELLDGSYLIGKVIDRDELAVLIRTRDLGELLIRNERIVAVRALPEDFEENGFSFRNSNPNTYFVTPSAIPLAKGVVRYTNVGLLGNGVSVGLSKNLSIIVGAELFSLYRSNRIHAGVGSKLGFQLGKRIHMAVSGVYQQVALDGRSNYSNYGRLYRAGYAAGHFTYGNSDLNATVTTGYLFADAPYQRGLWFGLSGMARATTRVAFIMENLFKFKNEFITTGFGVRYLARTVSVDLGAVFSTEFGPAPIPFPYAGCAVTL